MDLAPVEVVLKGKCVLYSIAAQKPASVITSSGVVLRQFSASCGKTLLVH